MIRESSHVSGMSNLKFISMVPIKETNASMLHEKKQQLPMTHLFQNLVLLEVMHHTGLVYI